jgi:hypothetical protein
VSGPDEMIADALREIAAQAGVPRPMADAAWRAGRRRLAALTASTVAGAAAIVAAVLLPLAAQGGPGHGQPPSSRASQQAPAAPIHLRSPIQFRPVVAFSDASCPAGSGGWPASTPPGCVFLTGTGMNVTTVRSVRVEQLGTGGYALQIVLTPADTGKFAALTRQLTGQPSSRDQLAIFIDGHVIAHPVTQGPITGGTVQIPGFATRAQAESLLAYLRNR